MSPMYGGTCAVCGKEFTSSEPTSTCYSCQVKKGFEMRKPQKHAAVIKAWADGAEIEYKRQDGSWDDCHYPSWSDRTEFRIKPTKVVRWQWIQPKGAVYNPSMLTTFYSEDELRRHCVNADKMIKAEWTRMEFDE